MKSEIKSTSRNVNYIIPDDTELVCEAQYDGCQRFILIHIMQAIIIGATEILQKEMNSIVKMTEILIKLLSSIK
jgi:hypothetical protein